MQVGPLCRQCHHRRARVSVRVWRRCVFLFTRVFGKYSRFSEEINPSKNEATSRDVRDRSALPKRLFAVLDEDLTSWFYKEFSEQE